MNEFLSAFIAGESFLLCFLLFFFPLKQNSRANEWLSFFVFVWGAAFLGIYLEKYGSDQPYRYIIKIINSLQFLLAPSLYISILYFVNPTGRFKIRYPLHLLPFAIFAFFDLILFWPEKSLSTMPLLQIGETEVWIRDLLPFLVAGYVGLSYLTLKKHEENLQNITSSTRRKDLRWIRRFLVFLILPLGFWINDALSIFSFPILIQLTGYIYAGSIFFLAFNALRQGVIFPYENKDLTEIAAIIQTPPVQINPQSHETVVKTKQRLNEQQMAALSVKLNKLMEVEKIYLENELDLPSVAGRLGIGIHDTSFLINQIATDNFYNFINRFRVEEAKRLLTSDQAKNLNMLGIAYESGFNSKTAFYTAFKKWAGISPSEYIKQQENYKKDVLLDNSERS